MSGMLTTGQRYCAFEINGEAKYYICNRNENCCHFGCCVMSQYISLDFFHVWYYWILALIVITTCTGGGWWFRMCHKWSNEARNGTLYAPTRVSNSVVTHSTVTNQQGRTRLVSNRRNAPSSCGLNQVNNEYWKSTRRQRPPFVEIEMTSTSYMPQVHSQSGSNSVNLLPTRIWEIQKQQQRVASEQRLRNSQQQYINYLFPLPSRQPQKLEDILGPPPSYDSIMADVEPSTSNRSRHRVPELNSPAPPYEPPESTNDENLRSSASQKRISDTLTSPQNCEEEATNNKHV